MNARRAEAWALTRKNANRAYVAIVGLALLTLSLAGCSLNLGSTTLTQSADPSLNALPWCDAPLISFQDDSQPSQPSLTQWDSVKGALGFTPYLPTSLPKGSCLDLVGGSIHDPVFGGHLSITWVLPTSGPISFSEAPRRGAAVATTPQCATSDATPQSTASATTTAQAASDTTTICIGALGDTSVTIASHLSASALQTYYTKLQPNVDWQPATPAPTSTPTATTQS